MSHKPVSQCPFPSSLTHVHSLRALTTETAGELDVLMMLLVDVDVIDEEVKAYL